MFNCLQFGSKEININVQSIDDETGVSSDMENDEQKNRLTPRPRLGSTRRYIRFFRTSITSCTSRNTDDQCAHWLTCLPPEIIARVLYHLPLSDRKNVRLTCKLLNQCSKHVSITKMEKFCFPQVGSRLCEILSRTNSAVLNLVFLSSVDEIPVDVWRTCGDRVRSLHFRHFGGNRALLDVLLHCGGVQFIGFGECYSKPGADLKLLSILNDLIKLNITRTELRTLVLCRLGYDNLLPALFTVFPNLEHLHATYGHPELKMQCLKPCMRLRSLTYELLSSVQNCWSEDHIAVGLPKRFPCSLAVQNKLEVFRLSISHGCDSEWGEEVMFHVLRSCPKLREFRFSSASGMNLKTSDEVIEFVTLISNLRCLELGRLPRAPQGLSLPSTKFMLRMLSVSENDDSDELLLHILQHSPKMLHLCIRNGSTEEQFGVISRVMPEIHTLILPDVLAGLHSDDWHVEGFQNLKYLELWLYPQHFTRIQQIQFPRLKYVRLRIYGIEMNRDYDDIFIHGLRKILWNMPELETACLPILWLENRRESIELFQNLKNLRHLICYSVESRCLRRMFRKCPNLKYVSEFEDIRTRSYDSSTKRITITERFLGLGIDDWFVPSFDWRRDFPPKKYVSESQ